MTEKHLHKNLAPGYLEEEVIRNKLTSDDWAYTEWVEFDEIIVNQILVWLKATQKSVTYKIQVCTLIYRDGDEIDLEDTEGATEWTLSSSKTYQNFAESWGRVRVAYKSTALGTPGKLTARIVGR